MVFVASAPAQTPAVDSALQIRAQKGDSQAQDDLGVALQKRNRTPQDLVDAVSWFRQAANQGHVSASYDLGMCYATGQGVQADPALAVKWFKKAADGNHPDALFCLGIAYHEGKGIEKDLEKATDCFVRAGELGNSGGMYDAGIAYAKGEGVQKDRGIAYTWFQKAVANGVEDAKTWVEHLQNEGFGLPGVENGTGIVHGPNHAYLIQAPKGWVIDNAIWSDRGIFDVFYPVGKSFDESPVVGYSFGMEPLNESPDDWIKADLAQSINGAPAAKCDLQSPLQTKDGMSASTYKITNVPGKYPEWLAYIKAPTAVILVSVSVRSPEEMETGEKLLRDLVGSISWFTDKVIVSH